MDSESDRVLGDGMGKGECMKESYEDITSRIPESPSWYDQNGTPRYGEFSPERCPN